MWIPRSVNENQKKIPQCAEMVAGCGEMKKCLNWNTNAELADLTLSYKVYVIQFLQECVTAASLCDPSSGGHFHVGTIKYNYTSFIREDRPHVISKLVENFANFSRYFACRIVIGTKAKLAEEEYISEIKKKFPHVARIGVLHSRFSARILMFPTKETMTGALFIVNRSIPKAVYDQEIGEHAIRGYIEKLKNKRQKVVATEDKFWVQEITRELLVEILSEVEN
ncbi:hypothetical protein OROGR_026625 [Orobanche gracilis]